MMVFCKILRNIFINFMIRIGIVVELTYGMCITPDSLVAPVERQEA